MKRKKLPFFEKVEITGIGAEGKALARINDMVVFVPNVVPGDVIDIQINERKKNYQEGYPTRFEKYSALRREPACEHFGTCGGCKWQMLPYPLQLEFKQKQVYEQLTRIGKLNIPEMPPILASENEFYYRNKLEFTFSAHRWLEKEEMGKITEPTDMFGLGFHIPKMFDRVVDVNHCHLQGGLSNQMRNFTREYALKNGLEFYDYRLKRGFFRNMIVRTALSGQTMVVFSLGYEHTEKREAFLSAFSHQFPEVTSLNYVINHKLNDTILDLDVICVKGTPYIIEEMMGLKFKVGPKSFYQTNSQQAARLYQVALDFAQLTGNQNVFDLYTGTGTIAAFVARNAKKVVGIEIVPEAIEDAKYNAELNEINNISFHVGDMKDMLTPDFIAQHGTPDVVILDPPRAGLHEKVIEVLLKLQPKRIVYVSCNPATQARDLQLLDHAYVTTHIQAVDMFPQTHHVENVAGLSLR